MRTLIHSNLLIPLIWEWIREIFEMSYSSNESAAMAPRNILWKGQRKFSIDNFSKRNRTKVMLYSSIRRILSISTLKRRCIAHSSKSTVYKPHKNEHFRKSPDRCTRCNETAVPRSFVTDFTPYPFTPHMTISSASYRKNVSFTMELVFVNYRAKTNFWRLCPDYNSEIVVSALALAMTYKHTP